ncbi:DUF1659 domain-containing protein [uncultured Lactobacillus sp.]|uniref:DUF1659 domain-containing protein n=1 Tax=uncultured Lactobacillus sp. TaxID=153152 RepID=UPI002639C2B0|nr:DUF1659 domain-containing protein [uncultured Lactobacillus sp.]
MKSALVEQSVKFTFTGSQYKNNTKERTLKNLKLDAAPDAIAQVGKAMSELQKDDGLGAAVLIQHHAIELGE